MMIKSYEAHFQTTLGQSLTGFNLNGLSFAPAFIPDPNDALLQLIGGAETIFKNYMDLVSRNS
jgi:hypothetical protein